MWQHASSNRTFRLVWNTALGRWDVAPETARGGARPGAGRSTMARLGSPALLCTALLVAPATGLALETGALPSGGQVTAGQASLSRQGNRLVIEQGSERAILDWQSFDIGRDASVRFAQPSANATALNRVNGGTRSEIQGQLSANGQVYLVNGAGILFGPGAQVDTGGLVASTLHISDADFLAGRARFTLTDQSTGAVVNQGRINTRNGNVALLGRTVSNTGSLAASGGDVVLAAGREVSFAAGADGHLQLAVAVSDLAASVHNGGAIQADGGQILLNAQGADALAAAVVSNTGTLQARSIAQRNGRIVLSADADHGGTVQVAGHLDATSAQGRGGQISVTGQSIALNDAQLDVSGHSGGGSLKVGGDWQGQAGTARATITRIDSRSQLKADAIEQGDGGRVVVWSDQRTDFAGQLSARGKGTGQGGQAEVSGKAQLNYTGTVDLRADNGHFGDLLLDPYDVTLSNGPQTVANGFSADRNDSVINVTTLQNALANANVTVSTGSGGSQDGNITVAAPVSWTSGSTLTLDAYRNIVLNAALSGGNGGLTLVARGGPLLGASGSITATAPVSVDTFILQQGQWSQNSATLPAFSASDFRLQSGSFLRAQGGDGSEDNPYLLTDIYGVQGMQGFLSSNFRLANDIQAQETRLWNCSLTCAGFVPIGSAQTPFTGTLDGDDHVIDQLHVNVLASSRNDTALAGLFASLGPVSGIERLGLTNVSIRAFRGADNIAGGLAAQNQGAVFDSYVTGSVEASDSGATHNKAGGLVGTNGSGLDQNGTDTQSIILGSYANVRVLASGGSASNTAGGLVGELDAGDLQQSYASGAVTARGAADHNYAGGLVGFNQPGGLMGTDRALIAQSYATGSVAATGGSVNYEGGLLGQNYSRSVSDAYYATTDASGASINSGGGYNFFGQGKTWSELTSLATFTNWDIDASAGTGKTWRIYQGQTTPLLRSFLKALTATTNDAGRTYDGTTQTVSGTGYRLSDSSAQVLGSASYASVTTRNAGTYALGLSGLYSSQQGYDIAYAPGTYTVAQRQIGGTFAAVDKVYDGTTAATLSGGLNSGAIIAGDNVSFNATGSFANKNVGQAKTVSVTGSLSGNDAGNYLFVAPTGLTASITPRQIGGSFAAADKVYDGTTAATLSGGLNSGAILAGDSVSFNATGSFANKNVGQGKAVSVNGALGGNDAANYSFIAPIGLTANITPRQIGGFFAAADKTYDGTTAATLSGGLNSGAIIAGDNVSFNATGSFANKNVGQAKAVSVNGTLGGSDAGNYLFVAPTGLTASITPANLLVTANDLDLPWSGRPYSGGNGVSYTGLVPGDSASILAGLPLVYGGSAQGAVAPGRYTLQPLGPRQFGNYSLSYRDGSLDIVPSEQSDENITAFVLLPPGAGEIQSDLGGAGTPRKSTQARTLRPDEPFQFAQYRVPLSFAPEGIIRVEETAN